MLNYIHTAREYRLWMLYLLFTGTKLLRTMVRTAWHAVGTPTKLMALGEALQLFPLEALPELTDGQVFEMEYSYMRGIKVEIKLA